MDLKLQQKELAEILGTNASTIINWERQRNYPNCQYLKVIMDFLGYWPYDPKVKTLGQRIKRAREFRSLTLRQLGQLVHIDPTTLAHWEQNKRLPNGIFFQRVDRYFSIG